MVTRISEFSSRHELEQSHRKSEINLPAERLWLRRAATSAPAIPPSLLRIDRESTKALETLVRNCGIKHILNKTISLLVNHGDKIKQEEIQLINDNLSYVIKFSEKHFPGTCFRELAIVLRAAGPIFERYLYQMNAFKELQEIESSGKLIAPPVVSSLKEFFLRTHDKMRSEGLGYLSSDTCAISHFSTHSTEYFRSTYDVPELNMDRGFVLARKDGTHFACVCDGITGFGISSFHFAKEIAEFIRSKEKEIVVKLCIECPPKEKKLWIRSVFNGIGLSSKISHAGSTCVFVSSVHLDVDKFFIVGAALGDSSAIHLNLSDLSATQLNTITRDPTIPGDPGGALLSRNYCNREENTSLFFHIINRGDVILAVSDGLTDNLESIACIPFIICNRLFDSYNYIPEWKQGFLPPIDYLKGLIKDVDIDLTPSIIAHRLNTYIEWVTWSARCVEVAYYSKGSPLVQTPVCGKPDDTLIIAFQAQ